MIENLKVLFKHRELLWTWSLRSIKVRYKQSILGVLWAILQPLSLMVVFSVIFTRIVQVPTQGLPYPIFSYTALLPWTFFSASIGLATPSLISNFSLVTKIYLPREIFPVSAVIASFVDFLVATVVFVGLIAFYRVPVRVTVVMVPLLVCIQTLLILGVALAASAVNVFYRDVRFVVPLGLQLWMYATPIIYPITLVPERYRMLYLLNPMTPLIQSYRAVMLEGVWPDWRGLAISAGISATVFILGYVYFKRVEWRFADII